MDRMVAYCGLVCTECEAYLATQANDLPALEQMAQKAREEFGMPDTMADGVRCDGCLPADGYKCGYCAHCQVRACAIERGLPNCAHCDDYACEKLEAFFGMAAGARGVLDEIRAGL